MFMALTLVSLANAKRVITGDERTELYFHLLEGKRIALYSNHTGLANGKHIVDILKENKFDVTTILSPEHGFRGTADAGERVGDSVDEKTNIPIISMYKFGREGIDSTTAARFDILVVDIQDVGLRFYTYYITIHNKCIDFHDILRSFFNKFSKYSGSGASNSIYFPVLGWIIPRIFA